MKLIVKELGDRVHKQLEMNRTCTDEAAALLAKEGFDPQFGARPLKWLIVHSVENVLSKKIVNGEIKSGDSVEIFVNNGEIDVK